MNKEEIKKELESIAEEVYGRMAFADYPHCETVYADTDHVRRLTKRIRGISDKLDAYQEKSTEQGFALAQDVKQADFEQWKTVYKSSLLEQGENMKKIRKPQLKYECQKCGHGSRIAECFCGYNQGIDDIINLIKEGKE